MTSDQNSLDRLKRVDLREVWEDEASKFTPWLAQEDNLDLLGDTIGIDLELEATEKDVGPFRADILCKDTVTEHWVLIENQLAKTDHGHLGQLLTYAAGLNAVTIVWIAAPFTDEHRATLDWLNDITDDDFRFFGLEIEAWRIGDSLPAPKFNIISKPNDWSRSLGQAARQMSTGELTNTQGVYLRYWMKFREHLSETGSPLRPRSARPSHYFDFSIGKTGYWVSAVVSAQEKWIGVMLNISDDPDSSIIGQLAGEKETIEAGIGASLEWREMRNRKASRIVLRRSETDPLDQADWSSQFEWLDDALRKFESAFRQRVRKLEAGPSHSDDEEIPE